MEEFFPQPIGSLFSALRVEDFERKHFNFGAQQDANDLIS